MGELVAEDLLTELESRLDVLLDENTDLKRENELLKRQLDERVGGIGEG